MWISDIIGCVINEYIAQPNFLILNDVLYK